MGKTEWARSLGRHMYFNGMFDLGQWDDTAEYAIFDDWCDWTKLYFYKQFLGSQREFIVTDKYKHKRSITWGKPAIVISNERPKFEDERWIELNCFQCHLLNKLF